MKEKLGGIMAIPDLTLLLSQLGVEITISRLIAVGALILVGFGLNKISNLAVDRAVERRGGDKNGAITAKKLTAYIIYPFTLIAVLGVFGLPLSSLGTAVGLIGLGISFALRDMIANFFSGILILITKPFKVGDQIKTGGEEGTVQDINIRATDIRTYDGRKLIVPNSQLYNGVVINNTAYDNRRIEVIVGVGYDEDIQTAKELAEEALEDSDMVEEDPSPQVLVNELGGSSVNLKLRGWTKPSKSSLVEASSDITQNIKQKYDDEGIDIPYPIRTIYMEDDQ